MKEQEEPTGGTAAQYLEHRPTGASLAAIVLAVLCFGAVMLLHAVRGEILGQRALWIVLTIWLLRTTWIGALEASPSDLVYEAGHCEEMEPRRDHTSDWANRGG